MRPELYTVDQYGLPLNRIGGLADAISCTVTEELNGKFTLTLEQPPGTQLWNELQIGRAIRAISNRITEVADPSRNPQTFLITKRERTLGGVVRITAEHVSYLYAGCVVKAFANNGFRFSALTAWQRGLQNAIMPLEYGGATHSADLTTQADAEIHVLTPISWRDYVYNMLIPAYGGELRYNDLNVWWMDSRGKNRGAKINYGGNMMSLTAVDADSSMPTGFYPYYGKLGDEGRPYLALTQDPVVISYTQAAGALYVRNEAVDLTSRFETAPATDAELRAVAEAFRDERVLAAIPESLTVSHADIAGDTMIGVGDSVLVRYLAFGIEQTRKVQSLTFDVLNERIKSITLGNKMPSLAETILKYGGINSVK